MKDVGLDEARNEKERFMEPYMYDLSRNTDMKQTCFMTKTKLNNDITSKKTNIDTTERNKGPLMNVKNEERGTRSNQRGHRSRSKGKHKRL